MRLAHGRLRRVDLELAFDHADLAGDGVVTKDEFKCALLATRGDLVAQLVDTAFAALDVSHTGKITASDVMACAAGLGVKVDASDVKRWIASHDVAGDGEPSPGVPRRWEHRVRPGRVPKETMSSVAAIPIIARRRHASWSRCVARQPHAIGDNKLIAARRAGCRPGFIVRSDAVEATREKHKTACGARRRRPVQIHELHTVVLI